MGNEQSKEDELIPCPVCGGHKLADYDVCPKCGWENDYDQRKHPDWDGMANDMSLNEAREAYKRGKKIH